MSEWIEDVGRSARGTKPGCAVEEIRRAETEAGFEMPRELASLYERFNGGGLPGGVQIYPLHGDPESPGVMEKSRKMLVGLPAAGLWRFGRQGEHRHLFAARKSALQTQAELQPMPEWTDAMDDDAWLFGIWDEDQGELRLFPTFSEMMRSRQRGGGAAPERAAGAEQTAGAEQAAASEKAAGGEARAEGGGAAAPEPSTQASAVETALGAVGALVAEGMHAIQDGVAALAGAAGRPRPGRAEAPRGPAARGTAARGTAARGAAPSRTAARGTAARKRARGLQVEHVGDADAHTGAQRLPAAEDLGLQPGTPRPMPVTPEPIGLEGLAPDLMRKRRAREGREGPAGEWDVDAEAARSTAKKRSARARTAHGTETRAASGARAREAAGAAGRARGVSARKAGSRKAPARKAASRKAASRKAPARKAPARKAPARKAPARKAVSRKVPAREVPGPRGAVSRAAPRTVRRSAGSGGRGAAAGARRKPGSAVRRAAPARAGSTRREEVGARRTTRKRTASRQAVSRGTRKTARQAPGAKRQGRAGARERRPSSRATPRRR